MNARVLARYEFHAVGLERLRELDRRAVRVEPHAGARFAERLELLHQRGRLGEIKHFAQRPLDVVADLGGIDVERRLPARRYDGESKRDRRMPDVAAPNVEQPGDRIEHGEQHGVDVLVLEPRLHVADLVLRALARIFEPMRHDLGAEGLRPVLPDEIDEIGVNSSELDAGLAQSLGQPLDLLDRVQRRVVADHRALGELLGDPARCLGVRRLQHFEQRGVGLRARLQRVAPVDEQRRRLLQHDGHAGGSGEAGEPGQALGGRGEEFVLVLVAMRNEKALELSRFQFPLQRLDPLAARGRGTDIIENLIHGRPL